MIDLVFNEHSCIPLATSVQEAKERMTGFVLLLAWAMQEGLSGKLRTPEHFYSIGLSVSKSDQSSDYFTIAQWLEKDATREERAYLLHQGAGLGFFAGLSSQQADKKSRVDIRPADKSSLVLTATQLATEQRPNRECDNGQPSAALTAAYIFDYPLLSFCHEVWGKGYVECKLQEMDETSGEITGATQQLVNFSTKEHFSLHRNWIKQRKQRALRSLTQFWPDRAIWFPNLSFAPTVEKQVVGTALVGEHFRQVMLLLQNLSEYNHRWQQGSFDYKASRCSRTSNQTLKKHKQAYTFTSPQGSSVTAKWHLYFTPGAGRIYFSVDETARSICICHIGEKLPDMT